jgi:hypothetical protein
VDSDFVDPDDIDRRLSRTPGTAARLARRGRLPHYVLPDKQIRFRLDEVLDLVRHVPTTHSAATLKLHA